MSMIPSKIKRDSSGSSSEISTPTSLNRYFNLRGYTTSFKAIKSEAIYFLTIEPTMTVHRMKVLSTQNVP